MLILLCKIVKYGTKMEIKNLTTTTYLKDMDISLDFRCPFPGILFFRAKVVQKVNQSYAAIITRENTDKIF